MNHAWRKTLASALLEGTVVFVGIMGAIFANSWWDAREARAREHDYVVSLSEDFDENQARLEQAIESSGHVKAAAMELLVIENAAQGMALGTDSLTALLRGLQALPTFEPVTKTYDNLLGSGDLLTLRSGELRSSLADFQSRLLLMKRRPGDTGTFARRDLPALHHRASGLSGDRPARFRLRPASRN